MIGIDTYKTKESFKVVRVHYTADPNKRSKEAVAELEKGYPGGRTGPAWRKEMEIDFTAYSGQLLCYNIMQQYRSKIIVDKYIPAYCIKTGSLDWGRNNPASFHIYTVDEHKNIHSAHEIYIRDISIPDFSALIKQSPYYGELTKIIADPSVFSKNQEELNGVESLADKFRAQGITLTPAPSRNDEIAINELLDRWYKLDESEPRFTISPKCPKQIWEFERLRYKELSTAMLDQKNPHEALIDKDNHSWDDFKYFIAHLLHPAELGGRKELIPETSPMGRMNELKRRREAA